MSLRGGFIPGFPARHHARAARFTHVTSASPITPRTHTSILCLSRARVIRHAPAARPPRPLPLTPPLTPQPDPSPLLAYAAAVLALAAAIRFRGGGGAARLLADGALALAPAVLSPMLAGGGGGGWGGGVAGAWACVVPVVRGALGAPEWYLGATLAVCAAASAAGGEGQAGVEREGGGGVALAGRVSVAWVWVWMGGCGCVRGDSGCMWVVCMWVRFLSL